MRRRGPFILAVLSAASGCLGLAQLLAGEGALSLACHLFAAATGGWAAVRSDARRLGRHFFHAVFAAGMPFFGGFAAFFLAEAVKRKRAGSLAGEFAVYLNDAASFRESVPVADADIPSTDDIAPLHDILLGNAPESEQRIAVENLVSMETPEALEILRRVAEVNKSEGRFFAMTALGQMEAKLLEKLQRQEAFVASGRDGSVTPILETAATYIDFVYYRIALDARRTEYLNRAAELLEAALNMPGRPDSALLLLGRVRLLAYDGEGAMDCFNSFLEAHPDDPGALVWRAEAWHCLGEYDRVRADCLAASRTDRVPAAIRPSVLFWTGGGVEAGEPDEAEASA